MHGTSVFAHLPAELLQRIFAMLPHHEDILHALSTCKAWHEVAQDPVLWASYAARCGIKQGTDVWHGRRRLDSLDTRQWRTLIANVLGQHCYQCGHEDCSNVGVASGCFWPNLCCRCADSFQLERASHRVLSRPAAMRRYKLRVKDVELLPHASVRTTTNPSRSSALFRRPDVVQAAVQRWGSVPAMWKQMRPYRGKALDAMPCSLVVAAGSADDDRAWLPKVRV